MEIGGIPFGEVWAAVRRRFQLLLISVAVVTPLGLVVAAGLPATYTSTAKILVEGRQMPDSLVRSTVEVGAAERLSVLREHLLTRGNLLELAERLDLFADRPDLSATEIQRALRAAIVIEDIDLRDRATGSRAPVSASAFTISYRAADAETAAAVVNELVAMTLEQSARMRAERAAETRVFLERTSKDLAVDLETLEREIAVFKTANGDLLPDSLALRRTELGALAQESRKVEGEILALDERKLALFEGIAGRGQAKAAKTRPTPAEADLKSLELQIARARGVYAESHPTVRALASKIDALKSAVAETDAAAALAAETSAADLRREIAAVERRRSALDAEVAKLDDRQATLRASIQQTPEVEVALRALERRHADLSARYRDAVGKEAAAAAGERLELSRQVERFRILERARAPETADWPPRKLIALGGAGASVALGVMLMIGAELANQSVRTANQIERRANIRPLATIPLTRSRRARRRRALRVAVAAVALIALNGGALVAIDRLQPAIDIFGAPLTDRIASLASFRDG